MARLYLNWLNISLDTVETVIFMVLTGILTALVIDGYVDYTGVAYYNGMLSVCDPNYTSHKSLYFVMDQIYPYTIGSITTYIDEHIIITN